VGPLTLSHTLPALLCPLSLSCTLLVPRLLGRDPWWWHHGPTHPLPHTPGATVPAHPLSHTPGTAFAWLGCLVVVPCARSPSPTHSRHCVCSVRILGGGAMCLSLPPLTHSRALPMQKVDRQKEASQRGALTSTRVQSKELVRTAKESQPAMGTHELSSAE
jgi:hypothetical protein